MANKRFGLLEALGRADMNPYAVETDSEKPPLLDGHVPQAIGRETSLRCGVEEAGVEDLQARPNEGCEIHFGAALQHAPGIHLEIAAAGISDRRAAGRQPHKR